MTISPTSVSEAPRSAAFARLHPRMQRWIYDQGWTSLHDAQERAIGPIIDGNRDVIVAAATAAGKTEAAFLPILSNLASEADRARSVERDRWTAFDPWAESAAGTPVGVQALYLSPLKALINDQYQRLEQMCERVEIPVHRWHGDVAAAAKKRLVAEPSGILLITPESLEAILVNRGAAAPRLFAGLRYVVIDELHSFLAGQRGVQLQSLMNRVEQAVRIRPPRIGLSATLGDMRQAAAFLRPTDPHRVFIVESHSDGRELRLQLRGYTTGPPAPARQPDEAETAGLRPPAGDAIEVHIAEHLFRHLRGQDNLVFANTRNSVEIYADLLARRSESAGVPNEFWPHHGNLSKSLREAVEAQLRDPTRPGTAVSTSTLELGIDIGSVTSVAQIGPPPSIAALRQRLGRSGRRDDPALLRLYVSEGRLDGRSRPVEQLRCGVVRTAAMVRLMLDGWIETPNDPGFNYSTLIQQIMSTIAQHGGATATGLYRVLCGPGPFRLVDQERFARLLRAMAARDLLVQSSDGLLLHGTVGERQVNNYRFYAAFRTADEWRIVARARTLGTIPIHQPLKEGMLMIFAGKRWKVIGIDAPARVVEVESSAAGVPLFAGVDFVSVSDEVRAEMVAVYTSTEMPAWLDSGATQLLAEGRAAFDRFRLGERTVLADGEDLLLFPWVGDRALHTAVIALHRAGMEASVEGPAIRISVSAAGEPASTIRRLLDNPPPTAGDLAEMIKNREIDKWDWVLEDRLSCESAGARLLDVSGAWKVLARVAEEADANGCA